MSISNSDQPQKLPVHPIIEKTNKHQQRSRAVRVDVLTSSLRRLPDTQPRITVRSLETSPVMVYHYLLTGSAPTHTHITDNVCVCKYHVGGMRWFIWRKFSTSLFIAQQNWIQTTRRGERGRKLNCNLAPHSYSSAISSITTSSFL